MKIGLLCIMVFCLISCANTDKKETKSIQKKEKNNSLQLNDTLRIGTDFTISYLKIDSLTYSDFKKQNKVIFEETKHGSLSCGDSSPMWSSSTNVKNDTLGIELNFSKNWVENTPKPKEEVLNRIVLNKAKAKFYNGIILGKSNITEVKEKFGKPINESNYVLEYSFKETRIVFFYNKQYVVYYVALSKAYQVSKPQDSLAFY
ncbi:hypothetical protein [Cellulophaga fucicola]|uniref:hypothetical protein n=1 Tax=Cellulophaga fucicola TaxID=76595 RepID=UPI003EB89612